MPVITRSEYRDDGQPDNPRSGATGHGESMVDFEDYLLPADRLRTAALHGWGVASGLGVTAAAGAATVTVAPGTAVDRLGRVILLVPDGVAVLEPPPPPPNDVPTVPVLAGGVALGTVGLSGSFVVVVSWLEAGVYSQPTAPQLLHAPWLQLVPAAGFADTGEQVVLAAVTVDATGAVTALAAGVRRTVDSPTGRVRLRRPRVDSAAGQPTTVGDPTVAELTTRADGGVDLTVALPKATTAAVSVAANRAVTLTGPVTAGTTLTVTKDLAVRGRAQISGAVSVGGAASLAAGAVVTGALAVTGSTTLTGTTALNGAVSVGAALSVAGATALSSGAAVTGGLKVTGTTTLTGAVSVGAGLTVAGPLAVTTGLDVSGAATVGGHVTASGAIRPSAGLDAQHGIQFPANPGGGAGDEAFIRYGVVAGEDTALVIGCRNDAGDRISFVQGDRERLALVGGMAHMGTTDGASTASDTVVGALGFWGFGVQHGQLAFRAGRGFELVDMSVDGPRTSYGLDTRPYCDLRVRQLWLKEGGGQPALINSTGRLHISGAELLYVLNKNGMIVGKEWGGNGNLVVQGTHQVLGNLGTTGYHPVHGLPQGWGGGVHTWDVYSEGSVGCGTNGEVRAWINSGGAVSATVKHFVIDHPLDPHNRSLVHATVEGPEHGVSYRGEGRLAGGSATVTLPDYFEGIARPEGRTVHLTPVFEDDSPVPVLAASRVRNGTFDVRTGDGSASSVAFCWEVRAARADVDLLATEIPKTSPALVTPHAAEPASTAPAYVG